MIQIDEYKLTDNLDKQLETLLNCRLSKQFSNHVWCQLVSRLYDEYDQFSIQLESQLTKVVKK
jgi:hypothetical protein